MRRASCRIRFRFSEDTQLRFLIRTGTYVPLLLDESCLSANFGVNLCFHRHRNPFNDRVIASASEDGKVFLWEVPEDFTLHTDAEEITDVSPMFKLAGHSRYA